MISVLITSAGSTPAQILARGLDSDPRVNIIHLADMKKEIATPQLIYKRCKQYVVPNSDHPMYSRIIKDIISSNNIDLVIPTLPLDIIELFGVIPSEIIVSTSDSIKFCDKEKTYEAFKEVGIPYPRVWKWDLSEIEDTADYPLIIKPKIGMAGVGIKVIYCFRDIVKFGEKNKTHDYILQEYIVGSHEYTTDVVCNREGKPMGMCTRRRIETKNGLCTVAETVETPEFVEECIRRLCEKYRFYGQINVQYLSNDGSNFLFLEVNPRPAGSAAISYRAGMNISQMIIDAHLGVKRMYRIPEIGIVMNRYWSEVYT